MLVGREACQACLAAVGAGEFLGPRGSAHYLAGCDIAELRQGCVDATRRALPGRAAELVRQRRCDDAKTLLQFAERGAASSPQLLAAVKPCAH